MVFEELRANRIKFDSNCKKNNKLTIAETHIQACFKRAVFLTEIKLIENINQELSEKLKKKIYKVPASLWNQYHYGTNIANTSRRTYTPVFIWKQGRTLMAKMMFQF